MDIKQLTGRLNEINRMGYVVSKRKGNTGIGYTLETLLGLQENNLKTPDFGEIEVKSQRKNSSNRVTMFTFNKGAWQIKQRELIEKYGYTDTNKRPSLYCTVNSKVNPQGLYLKTNAEATGLYHVDKTFIAQWKGADLANTFNQKMPSLVIISADTRTNSENKEEFWFNEAYFLTEPDKNNFLDLIKKDIIIIDIRMHLKGNRVVRNHGTGFRIEERFLNLCFGKREQLV